MVKSKIRHRYILLFAAIAALVISVAAYSYLQSDVRSKEAEFSALQAELVEVQAQNNEIATLIDSNDERQMFEHLARERGFVYPDEKIYYNVTPGN
ncbi:MAG: septum formation initiator family protein [Clostridia bacterium]|nr:septum formation initiator family protein [Clostridia bacterium]